jgi:hypothetical protein
MKDAGAQYEITVDGTPPNLEFREMRGRPSQAEAVIRRDRIPREIELRREHVARRTDEQRAKSIKPLSGSAVTTRALRAPRTLAAEAGRVEGRGHDLSKPPLTMPDFPEPAWLAGFVI